MDAHGQTLTGAGVTMVERTRPRDEEFAAYMQARQPSLLRTAYLLTGDRHTAEDLVQTALAKLYLSWDKVQQRDSIDGYVRRILINENNSLWRRGWKKREYATGDLPDDDHVTDEYDEGQRAAVWAVVVLRYYEDLSEAEVAEILGISVGTVKSQASRALATLRERAPQHLNPLNREEER